MGLAAQHVECAGGRVLVLRGPERAQLHAQQLLLRMAVMADHGVVHRQQTQAVAVADPHGLRMFGKERAVLLLGRTQLRVHAPQLQHGAQRFGQDAQVQQMLRLQRCAPGHPHLEQAREQRAAAQRHADPPVGGLRTSHILRGGVRGYL